MSSSSAASPGFGHVDQSAAPAPPTTPNTARHDQPRRPKVRRQPDTPSVMPQDTVRTPAHSAPRKKDVREEASLLAPLQTWQRVAAAAVMAVPQVILVLGVRRAQTCFALFAQGEVFSSRTTALLRQFAGWVAAAALATILASTLVSVLLTQTNPPGLRQLAIGVGSNHVFTLFFAATVWLMAAVIGQGQALAEENQRFV